MPELQHSIDLEKLIKDDLDELPAITTRPCIFKIPQNLRDVNPKAYTPIRVAIGPYHADVEQLKSMESHKLRYLDSLMSRSGGRNKLKQYTSEIEKIEAQAWQCYSKTEDLLNRLDSPRFKKMLLLDGAFIVEFLCRVMEKMIDNPNEPATEYWSSVKTLLSGSVYDPIIDNQRTTVDVHRDLILLENQLPYFVLEALFSCTFSSKNPIITFTQLVLRCLCGFNPIQFKLWSPDEVEQRSNQETVMHLVHLMRMYCINVLGENSSNEVPSPRREGKHNQHEFRHCIYATELHEAGIRFKRDEERQFIDVRFDEPRGVLELPHLRMDEFTEMFFRNVMAFEQYHLNKFQVTNYMYFMDGLIDTTKDVHILEESHLIFNMLESKENVANIFNNITKHTTTVDYDKYVQLSNKLIAYTNKPWNKWKAMLHRDYFGSPWAVISVTAAVVLLILTALQTIATVRSTHWH